MKYLIALILCCLPIRTYADKQPLSDSTQLLLRTLDEAVEGKNEFHAHRQAKVEKLKQQASQAKGISKVNLYREIFDLYSHYQTDSAQVYLEKLKLLPQYAANAELQAYVHIAQAELYSISSFYDDALDVMRRVPHELLDDEHTELRLYYYRIMRTLYGWMMDYSQFPAHYEHAKRQMVLYRDSLLQLPGQRQVDYDIVRADKLNMLHQPKQALALLQSHALHMNPDSIDPYICYTLSESYNQLKQEDKSVYYLALAALADLRNATTEYGALPLLAQKLFERGDIDRSYRYLLCAMEDAHYCKAALRSIETSKIFPIINKQYKKTEQEQKDRDKVLMYTLIAVLVILTVFLIALYTNMRKMHRMRKEQADTNVQLEAANRKMQEALREVQATNEELHRTYAELRMTDKVKEEYIARYLNRCREYLDKLAEYRRTSTRLLKEHKIEELYKLSKSEETMKVEQESFYNDFDSAFLTLFPDFIARFNALLRTDAQIEPKYNGRLNTELRIFALIRLGVTDSGRIAHFLNFSLATVYNYRSKLRNKAAGNPAEFEQAVSEL